MSIYSCTVIIIFAVLFNEFIADFLVISQCKWPTISNNNENNIHALILADTHLLGPIRGHWLDKFYREWHMRRAFQTAVLLLNPHIVFVLGDLFDEGDMVNNQQFGKYVQRFKNYFHTAADVPLISAAGNHDIGFHYKLHPFFAERFEAHFNNTGVQLYTFHGVNFVVINSMAMENDGCEFCQTASTELHNISDILEASQRDKKADVYSQPIIMQHFPTYRRSDNECEEHDSPVLETYGEKREVLSKHATDLIGRLLNPRLFFAGHSHNYCFSINRLGLPEYTVASFSWRNKINPSFMLATFSKHQHFVKKCDMLTQTTVYNIYKLILFFVSINCIYSILSNLIKLFKNPMKYHLK